MCPERSSCRYLPVATPARSDGSEIIYHLNWTQGLRAAFALGLKLREFSHFDRGTDPTSIQHCRRLAPRHSGMPLAAADWEPLLSRRSWGVER